MSLQGKTAIVTGASKGIGHAIALALHREGVSLKLLSRTKPEAPGEFIACDFSKPESIPTDFGLVDFLVNNAGTFLEKPVPEISLEDWEHTFHVNMTATFLVTRAVLPQMIAQKQGRILFIASTASAQGYLHQSAYVASKHAMLGFARALAIEARPYHIHVNSICPGGVDTDLIKGTYLGNRLAGQPMIAPADIAEMVVFLLKQPGNVDIPELVVRRYSPNR